MEELIKIQHELNAPKNQYNSFGKYKYRSCEDILAAAKDLLYETGCALYLTDEVLEIGNRYYVKATACITNSQGKSISVTAFAREAEEKKGMDESQITGATSSYARKYALNGLFAIDDAKDSDSLPPEPPKRKGKTIPEVANAVAGSDSVLAQALTAIQAASTTQELLAIHSQYPQYHNNDSFMTCLSARKKQIQ